MSLDEKTICQKNPRGMDQNIYVLSNFWPISDQCSLSYRNQSTDLHCKSIDWFLCDYDDDDDDDDDDDVVWYFVVWLTDERGLALFPAGTIVTGPHYRKSPRRSMQDLKLNQLRHSGSPVNLLHIFRRTFSKNTSGQLFL